MEQMRSLCASWSTVQMKLRFEQNQGCKTTSNDGKSGSDHVVLLVSVSEDAWFGTSIAQRIQMSRMRAM